MSRKSRLMVSVLSDMADQKRTSMPDSLKKMAVVVNRAQNKKVFRTGPEKKQDKGALTWLLACTWRRGKRNHLI